MSYKLQIVDPSGLQFNARYQNLARKKKPSVTAKSPTGKDVKERTLYQGTVLMPGDTQRKFVDEDGNIFGKQELTFWYEGGQVEEIEQTKVFEIEGYQPVANYTDKYVIGTFYEVFPSDNDMKKDYDKARAIQANTVQMRKLWEYLTEKKVVARGEFCTSSKGFVASDGYIRAICLDGNKWGLEIGVFKEEKIFEHLQEGTPSEVVPAPAKKGKKLKMV